MGGWAGETAVWELALPWLLLVQYCGHASERDQQTRSNHLVGTRPYIFYLTMALI